MKTPHTSRRLPENQQKRYLVIIQDTEEQIYVEADSRQEAYDAAEREYRDSFDGLTVGVIEV